MQSPALVNRRFTLEADFWQQVYEQRNTTLFNVIHQRRQQIALTWFDELDLGPEARILEVGCGTGSLAVALAQRGRFVVASDTVPAMIDLTRLRADRAGVSTRVASELTSADALGFSSRAFSAAFAMGVLPWLGDVRVAVAELTRTLVPGGYLIANVDNRARLDVHLDPVRNPVLARSRVARREMSAQARLHGIEEFDAVLAELGLTKLKGVTVGFGPITIWRHNVLPDRVARTLDTVLQRLACAGVPGVRSLGTQYIVLARKQSD